MTEQQPSPNLKIGIIGGGQLAKMMGEVVQRWGLFLGIYDPNPACPAQSICHQFVQGQFNDGQQIAQFAKNFDVVTYDLEHVNVDGIIEHASSALKDKFYPSPQTLKIIQDKQVQKQFYLSHHLPAAPLYRLDDVHYPCVWKARQGGYDGKGVRLLKTASELNQLQSTPYILEAAVNIQKELAVMVVRNKSGDMKCYPCVDMHIDQSEHVLTHLMSPAQIDKTIKAEAQKIAMQAVEALNGVGIFGVELFLDNQNQVLINEIAPRPHNSGHHTLEAFNVSQFEQHIRAICGFSLANIEAKSLFSASYNILAEPGYIGEAQTIGLKETLQFKDVFVHIYGKHEAKPGRKMGHVTVLGQSAKDVQEKMMQVKQILKIKGKEKD